MEKDLCRMEKKFIHNLELNNYRGRKKEIFGRKILSNGFVS